jgi:uncharacterized protein (DUF952 family)
MALIYKISPRAAWSAAEAAGVFTGAPVDVADGYIHFSTAAQARETAAKHFAGQSDLVLAAIAVEPLGAVTFSRISTRRSPCPPCAGCGTCRSARMAATSFRWR